MQRSALFLHIPKTAGTTLSHYLRQIFEWSESLYIREPDHGLAVAKGGLRKIAGEYRAAYGHFHYGFVRDYREVLDNAVTLTVLRDPIQRTLSTYAFAGTGERGVDLLSHMTHSPSNHHWFFADNLMVRMLLSRWKDKAEPCTLEDLEEAKSNLAENIDIVGFQEDYSGFLENLGKLFSFEFENVSLNRSVRRLRTEDLTLQERQIVTDANILDSELYDWAKARKEQFQNKSDRIVATAAGDFSRFQTRLPDDGDYIVLQAQIDEAAAGRLSLVDEEEQREQVLGELRRLLSDLNAVNDRLDTQLSVLGGEIAALIALCGEVENTLNDRASLISGREAYARFLRTRLLELQSMTERNS